MSEWWFLITEAYKTLMSDPSQINNMDVETLKEISKLGFKKVVVNKKQADILKQNKEISSNIEIVGINSLDEALKL